VALLWEPGVAGCDEAGRGPLAGPVVCAAVLLPEAFDHRGLADSKALSKPQREAWEAKIQAGAVWAVEIVEPEEVDELNVLWASMAGMARALARLDPAPLAAIVDGTTLPRSAPCQVTARAKADATWAPVAAASVLAKVARDRLMVALDAEHPGYGFCHNFGYPTPDHLEALTRLGPCPIHRRSFGPVRDRLLQPCLTFAD
jgi:ribonuclease HII